MVMQGRVDTYARSGNVNPCAIGREAGGGVILVGSSNTDDVAAAIKIVSCLGAIIACRHKNQAASIEEVVDSRADSTGIGGTPGT